jgi:hypothetical protein
MHQQSPRSTTAFVPVNCSAIPLDPVLGRQWNRIRGGADRRLGVMGDREESMRLLCTTLRSSLLFAAVVVFSLTGGGDAVGQILYSAKFLCDTPENGEVRWDVGIISRPSICIALPGSRSNFERTFP